MENLLWPTRPRPLSEESFASWFSRVAHNNGLLPKDLFRVALPGAYLHGRDLDRSASPQLLSSLAEKTGIDLATINATTLDTWRGRLFEADEGINKLPWLPPVGREMSKRSFGQQLCPHCLCEHPAYLRKVWRLGFVTFCPRHKCLLIDRCVRCGVPVSISRGWSTAGRLHCFRCGMDFSRAPTTPAASKSDTGPQESLLRALEEGWLQLGSYGPVHSLAAFQILMLIYRLLATGRHALPLRSWLATRVAFPTRPPSSIPRIKEVELLAPAWRQELIRMAWHLLESWPSRFIDAAQGVGLSTRDLIRGEVPFAYWHAVSTHLGNPIRRLDRAEALAARAFLERQGKVPDYRSLVELTGTKFVAQQSVAVPAHEHCPYGKGRYWKLDGVSPAVREAVKRAARIAGENVASWVERALKNELMARDAILSPQMPSMVVGETVKGEGGACSSHTP